MSKERIDVALFDRIFEAGALAEDLKGASQQDRKAVEEACEFAAAMQREGDEDYEAQCEEAADALIALLPFIRRHNAWGWVERKLARLEARIEEGTL